MSTGVNEVVPSRRLLVVINSLGIGGAETQIRGLLPELSERGWDVQVLSLMADSPVSSDLRASGIAVQSMNLGHRDIRWLLAPLWVRNVIRKYRPHVVHAHLDKATIVTRLARAGLDLPRFVDTIHYTVERRAWRPRAFRMTSRWSDVTTLLSEEARSEQVGHSAVKAERTRVIPNAVDTDFFKPSKAPCRSMRLELGLEDEFVWVTVGRLIPEKDQRLLIETMALMHSRGSDPALVVVGDGPLRRQLEGAVDELSLSGRVRFIGAASDVRPFLRMADAFVLSSRSEGLPMALLEAMSCGLPVVGTSVGSIPLAIGEENTVPSGSAHALSAAMERIMGLRREERLAFGASMRERVQSHYSVSALASKWEEVYWNQDLGQE